MTPKFDFKYALWCTNFCLIFVHKKYLQISLNFPFCILNLLCVLIKNELINLLYKVKKCVSKFNFFKFNIPNYFILNRNPMGRTGVRGRGCLYRYGPNHEIMAVVTRWKKQKNKPVYVERRKLLEFVAVKNSTTGLMNIPG